MQAVLNAALPIFALIFTGFLCGRFGVLPPEATDSLTRFAIYLALPALMFLAMSRITPDQAGQIGFALAFAGGIAITFGLGDSGRCSPGWRSPCCGSGCSKRSTGLRTAAARHLRLILVSHVVSVASVSVLIAYLG